MADTSFSARVTTILSVWLNQVNKWLFWGRRPNFATTTGSDNAQVLTLETGSLYVAGQEADGDRFIFKAGFTNTGAMTLLVEAPGGLNVARALQFIGTALIGGEVVTGNVYEVVRLGTTWQLVNPTLNAFTQSLNAAATAAAWRTILDVPSNAESILDALIGAKGDLLVGTADNTLANKAAGTDGYVLQAQSGNADGLQYLPAAPFTIENGYLDWSVAGNILTVAIKTWAGTDPSATDPCYISFRHATVSNGSLVKRKITTATSITINNTALLGTVNATAFRLWCVAFDDGGTVRLGIINCLSGTNIFPLSGFGVASSTQEADASDNAHVFYTDGAAVVSKAYAALGFATWESGLATAGTWSAGPTRNQLFGLGIPLPGHVLQIQRNETGAVATGTTVVPWDDTIPQNTEGVQYMTQSIVPNSAASLLEISAQGHFSTNSSLYVVMALFQDAVANALSAAASINFGSSGDVTPIPMKHRKLAGLSVSTTFNIRAGHNAGAFTVTFNGQAGARFLGGSLNSFLEVKELMT